MTPEMADEVAVVRAWHEALNSGEADALAALTDDAVEIGGPRGSGRGVTLIREWAGRAGVRLDPGRVFRRGDAVVVEEVARWCEPGSPGWGKPLVVATAFRVGGGRVSRVVRFDDLSMALAFETLDAGDETGWDERRG